MSRSLQERLAALQRSVVQTGSQEIAADPGGNAPSVAAESVLTRQDMVSGAVPTPAGRGLEDLGFVQLVGKGGSCWVRTMRYDVLTRHGQLRFADLLDCSLTGLARAARTGKLDVSRMCFYDTETTGLGTGAGTLPFLHAVGLFEEDEFVVHQYFLDDYGEELFLLQTLLNRHFHDGTMVVSFNGKSFDWPMLKNRLAMHRLGPPDCPQVDLLYPSRRLWKGLLPRVALSSVEENVLGLQRIEDLPGKEAPARYFHYAEHRDAAVVEPVLDHNATDVCSLVVLTALLADILGGTRGVQSSGEWVALGRWYDEWREFDLASHCFAAATQAPDVDWRARWLSSLYFKRRGQWCEACDGWKEMAELHTWSVVPLVELAKYCEHLTRDYDAALHWTRMALSRALAADRQHKDGSVAARFGDNQANPVVTALRHRLDRIASKQAVHR